MQRTFCMFSILKSYMLTHLVDAFFNPCQGRLVLLHARHARSGGLGEVRPVSGHRRGGGHLCASDRPGSLGGISAMGAGGSLCGRHGAGCGGDFLEIIRRALQGQECDFRLRSAQRTRDALGFPRVENQVESLACGSLRYCGKTAGGVACQCGGRIPWLGDRA